jgi:hypothetical protein
MAEEITHSNDDPAMIADGAIYRNVCSARHAINGKDVPHLFPALADSSSVRSIDLITVIAECARSADRLIERGTSRQVRTSRSTHGLTMD